MSAIPFSMSAYAGLGTVKGLVRIDGMDLVLEFQVKDVVLGALKSGPKEVRVPLDQVVSMSLDEGWFNTTLRVQANSLKTWAGFPESDMGRVALSLTRDDRPAARNLVATVFPEKHPVDGDFA